MGNPRFTWNGYLAGIRECDYHFDILNGDLAVDWFLNRLAYRRAAFTRGFVRAAVDSGYLDPEEGIEVVERFGETALEVSALLDVADVRLGMGHLAA